VDKRTTAGCSRYRITMMTGYFNTMIASPSASIDMGGRIEPSAIWVHSPSEYVIYSSATIVIYTEALFSRGGPSHPHAAVHMPRNQSATLPK